MKVAHVLVLVPVWLAASVAAAQNPLSKLKALEDDGIGPSVLATFDACQALAPAPFGSFVPPDVVVSVPASTITIPDVTLPGPFPITIPGMTLTVPATSVTIPGSAFLPPPPRLCPVTVTGESAGSPPHPPGQSEFAVQLSVDYSTYRSNGSGGGCSLASGSMTFTKTAAGNPEQLTMNHAGLVCDTAGIGSAKTYTATYHVTGGTRKYVAASGTGDMALSVSATETLLHLDGNVLFR